jgi:hypothetical protein
MGFNLKRPLKSSRYNLWGAFAALLLLLPIAQAETRWFPPPGLQRVPVRLDCRRTDGLVGLTVQGSILSPDGAIFLCPRRMREIDARYPGASEFLRVHEYGHIALQTREEAAADRWAAAQLSKTAGGEQVLSAVVSFFVEKGDVYDPMYGSGFDRALRVAEAGGLVERMWPRALLEYRDGKRAARSATLRLRLGAAGYLNAAQMTVFIDSKAAGFLSNLDQPGLVKIPELRPGRYRLTINDVWLYHRDSEQRHVILARGLSATTDFQIARGGPLDLTIAFDEERLSVSVEER